MHSLIFDYNKSSIPSINQENFCGTRPPNRLSIQSNVQHTYIAIRIISFNLIIHELTETLGLCASNTINLCMTQFCWIISRLSPQLLPLSCFSHLRPHSVCHRPSPPCPSPSVPTLSITLCPLPPPTKPLHPTPNADITNLLHQLICFPCCPNLSPKKTE